MKNTFTIGFLTMSFFSGISYADDTPMQKLEETNNQLKAQVTANQLAHDTQKEALKELNDKITRIKPVESSFKGYQDRIDDIHAKVDKFHEQNDENGKRLDSILSRTEEANKKVVNYSKNLQNNASDIAHNNDIAMGLKTQFDDFTTDFDAHKKATNGAIAGVAAMSMLTVPKGIGNTALSAGTGYYNGQSAFALGITHRINAVTLRAGATYNTGSKEPSVNATIGYDF